MVTNQSVVLQTENQKAHQVQLLEELVQNLKSSGVHIAPTVPVSDTAIRASNGKMYTMTEVPSPTEAIEPVGSKELEISDSPSDFPAIGSDGDDECEKDVQDMINLELEGQSGTLVIADAEEVLMGGTEEPTVDFESTF